MVKYVRVHTAYNTPVHVYILLSSCAFASALLHKAGYRERKAGQRDIVQDCPTRFGTVETYVIVARIDHTCTYK